MTQLIQHYHDNRERLAAVFEFSALATSFNVLLCYGELHSHFAPPKTALADLLLTLACPELMKSIPKKLRANEVRTAISRSSQLRDDILTLQGQLQRAIRTPS